MSKKKSNFLIPKVKRQIEFEEEDFRTNDQIVCFDECLISKKEWNTFEANALVISDGSDVYQYADEYPIVKYTGTVESDTGFEEERLNGFITSVTVSTVMNGAHFSLKKREMKRKFTGAKTVAYYEDSIGRLSEIPIYDIERILMKKPNLVVSSDGLLIFYTKEECIATLDCVHYAWVDPRDIFFDEEDEAGNLHTKEFKVNEGWNIKGVTACDGFCIISYESVEDESDCHDVRVTFKIDNFSYGMISYETVWYHQ